MAQGKQAHGRVKRTCLEPSGIDKHLPNYQAGYRLDERNGAVVFLKEQLKTLEGQITKCALEVAILEQLRARLVNALDSLVRS